jgi:hypothetical protein
MAYTVSHRELSESVRVATVIGAGKIKPVWFEQLDKESRERIQIKEITYSWTYFDGAAKILCFICAEVRTQSTYISEYPH